MNRGYLVRPLVNPADCSKSTDSSGQGEGHSRARGGPQGMPIKTQSCLKARGCKCLQYLLFFSLAYYVACNLLTLIEVTSVVNIYFCLSVRSVGGKNR